MNILIVGANSKYAIELPYVKYLSDVSGVSKVDFFPAQNIFLEFYKKNLLNKLTYRAGLSTVLNEINGALIEFIDKCKPDFIFVFKGMEIFPSTLKRARDMGVKLVNYNPDNPFVFTGRGSGNSNVRKSIGVYDLHLTYDAEVKSRIENEFKIKSKILPFGYELDQGLFEICKQEIEINRACFLGNPDSQRARFVNNLASYKLPIDVYGHGWSRFVKSKYIAVYDAVYSDSFWKTLRKYRIQINLMRVHNPNSHNMRTFEVPAVGGIQLAPDTSDHRFFFSNGKEIFLYRNSDDCSNQAIELLSWPSSSALEVRENARSRSLRSSYSYKDRALQVFNELIAL
ncbi:MAG: glycosyltransferase [Cyclobacteriaceae bacterium]